MVGFIFKAVETIIVGRLQLVNKFHGHAGLRPIGDGASLVGQELAERRILRGVIHADVTSQAERCCPFGKRHLLRTRQKVGRSRRKIEGE